MHAYFPRAQRNWVLIACRIVGGVYEAAAICRVRPVVMKRWCGRGWVELVDHAVTLARAAGLSPLQVIGFADMPSLGRRRRRNRPSRRPEAARRDGRFSIDPPRGRRYGAAVWWSR